MLLEREVAIEKINDSISLISQSGKILLLSGEAGIGKTSLLEHIRMHADTSIDIFWCGCDPLFTPRPYAPIYDFAAVLSPNLLSHLENGAIPNIIFSSFYQAISQLKKPLILVIEDVHWADHSTLDLLKYVARRISFIPCLLCLSYRDDEVAQEHPLSSVLTLMPSAHTLRLHLEQLSQAGVTKLSKKSSYDPEILYKITSGNPFFIAELLANNDHSQQVIPASIREAVSSRVLNLTHSERDLLQVLSHIPFSIPVTLIHRLFNEVGESFAMACVARKLLQCDQHRVFKFRHELVRRTILEEQPAHQQKVAHKRILECLEQLSPDINVAWLVHHSEGALDPEKVLKYAPSAAENAASLGAHKEAASFYAKALSYVEYADTELAASLHESWAYEVGLTTHMKQSVIDARRHAISLWRALGRNDKVGENLRFLSRLFWYQGHAEKAEEYANQAINTFEAIPASNELAMAYSMRSQLDMLNDRFDEAVDWGNKALLLAERFSSPIVKAHALNNIGTALVIQGNEAGEAMLNQSLTIARQHGLHEDAARVYTNFSDYCIRFKKLKMAEELTAKGIQYDIAHDLDSWTYYLVGLQAQLRQEQGRLLDAQTIASGVQGIDNQTLLMKLPALIVLARVNSRLATEGSFSLLCDALEDAQSTNECQYMIPARLGLIEHFWLVAANVAVNNLQQDEIKRHIHWLDELPKGILNKWQLGELTIWKKRLGIEINESHINLIAQPYQFELMGEIEAAHQAWITLGMPFNAGMSLLHNIPSKEKLSKTNVLKAWQLFESISAKAALQWIRNVAIVQGFTDILPKARRGPYAKARQHPIGLTNKEQQVLKLLVTGASNQQIAVSLSRSNRTIENHVSSILSKLNVENRVEAMLRVQNEPWLSE
ncbi:helix-turn-helix transcriptional regulator [Paraglaciecola arctica]|uniref:helix-turn-helix transcriptional regulator n=1 Tax=Paraglaciecola arctica TaxID=1128911 RepID=UPI001C068219|nr:LuxR C-terminal-related transcriptional regulator [Paraglaciecola arctica]MBU3004704.1 LuxR C-terminal-related transcriptional regulator [Paraglaciecola arctica]